MEKKNLVEYFYFESHVEPHNPTFINYLAKNDNLDQRVQDFITNIAPVYTSNLIVRCSICLLPPYIHTIVLLEIK